MKKTSRDVREHGRIILAHGEMTGHMHEVVTGEGQQTPDLALAQFFEEPDGTRVLIAIEKTRVSLGLRHDEHGLIPLDPAEARRGVERLKQGPLAPGETLPGQYRQGDVLLHPIGDGIWRVERQRELEPEGWRTVAD